MSHTAVPALGFIVSAPRSGSTLLERMLEAHPTVLGGPEPHLMTPLAHLGVWAKAERAPYDIDRAAADLQAFLGALPEGESAYYAAVRAYCDTVYGRWHATQPDAALCLDKTPAYGLILPFMERVYPDARYIVLTRHPAATFASYATSFFDGDYATAEAYNPILARYVPALAQFLRAGAAARLHVRYEDLVAEPETWMSRICEHLRIPYDPAIIEYGTAQLSAPREGLGDPIGVQKHARPVTDSVDKWCVDLLQHPERLTAMKRMIGDLLPEDLATLGYPAESLWEPLERARTRPLHPAAPRTWDRYRLQRVAILRLRRAARHTLFRGALKRVQRVCEDVLRLA